MAKVTVTHLCGHDERIGVFGSQRDRDWRVTSEERKLCFDCYKQQQQAAAEAKAEAEQLPALVGTEKQVAWAVSIRAKLLEEIERAVLGEYREQLDRTVADGKVTREEADIAMLQVLGYVARVRQQTEARYWIDNRSASARSLLAAISKNKG